MRTTSFLVSKRRAAPRALALLAPIVIVAVLFAWGASPAAAAPMLTATPQTVSLPSCRSTGTSLISWSGVTVLSPQKQTTSLFVNDVQVLGPLPSASGTHTLTVTAGTSYVVTLKQISPAGAPPVTLATVTVTATCPGPPKPVCPKYCFSSEPKVTAYGTYATFSVATHAATSIGITVSTQPPVNGQIPVAAIAGKAASSGAALSHPKLEVLGLQAKTLYHYVLRAEDEGGFAYTATGTFTTLTRQVEVRFETIEILDDSDGGSEGELTFTFRVNNGPMKEVEAEAETGETVGLPLPGGFLALFTINDAPATLTLWVRGCDDDTTDFPPQGPPTDCLLAQNNGSTSLADWSTIEQTFNPASKTGPNEKHSVIFNMTATGSPLKFTAHGVYHVTYQ